ncbi:MAG: hypothetical protein D3910_23910, partial [Candidatus Electrothrix sp. ATG2]|nr:hypothetical protein [Candidatus Electrothrix sp. ATG2]
NGNFPLLRRNLFQYLLWALILVAPLLFCMGCDNRQAEREALALKEQASSAYKEKKDYTSLATLSDCFHTGMEQNEVTRLLGEPDYSPLAGLFYYSSDRRESVLRGKKEIQLPMGLIIDYRDEQGRVSKRLQAFQLGRIGE